MKHLTQSLLLANVVLMSGYAHASSQVFVDVNVEHSVGGISEFDRSKYITVHSMSATTDWDGDEDKLDYLFNDMDAYFGRDNGSLPWWATLVDQDPNRPGYADPNSIAELGKQQRLEDYGKDKAYQHKYEDRFHVMVGGQMNQLWLGNHTGKDGWTFKNTDAIGEYMGRFLNEFYRDEGQDPTQGHPRPKYLEVLNEPLWEVVDTHGGDPLDVFVFHNEVAEAIRKHNDDVMIGGYTTAFPWFDDKKFAHWNERMKLFIDTSAEYMDFFSVHFYDFGYLNRDRGVANFRGGRIEATLDMMEQYQMLKLGEIKPLLISEYGGRDHKTEQRVWSARNDWQTMKSFSPMMLQFMAKPDQIVKAIPFSLMKAEWSGDGGRNYPWRLMRHADEKGGEEGDHYVFSHIIKFYQLWSEVNGTRVDTRSDNADLLVDSYVDGEKAYVIISNLIDEDAEVSVNMANTPQSQLAGVTLKHLHFANWEPTLTVSEHSDLPESITIGAEGTVVIEYSYKQPLETNERAIERKYYADSYLHEIKKNAPINFQISDVKTNEFGEAVLRLSFGRKHRRSKQPVVTVNGTEIAVPENFAGDMQKKRPQFFSMLEIPVPNALLKEDNQISVTFPDKGGFVTTATLQTFEFSADIR
ncbi:hypothetical protein [Aliagarivorans marinus]|uniref:hypothetical protein n=1 Tax=Aliagarivorans marinus TaxID=561965 RepID=UPI0003FBF465|nr:hypothetical protein [Aliagarivorans marinus]